jgi:hypothetical protein
MEDAFDRNRSRLLKQAVEALAGVCDGALMRDDQGFDGTDTRAGHLYAFLPLDAWPLSVFHRAWHWTKKYHRQLEAMQLDCTNVQEPPLFEGEDRQIARMVSSNGYHVVFPGDDFDLIEEFKRLPGNALHRVPIGTSGKLFFRYRTYQGEVTTLLRWAEQNHFQLGPDLREHAQSNNLVVLERDSFALYFPDRTLNAEVKMIPCRSSSYTGGFHWVIAARRESAGPLRTFLTRHQFSLPADVEQRLQELER